VASFFQAQVTLGALISTLVICAVLVWLFHRLADRMTLAASTLNARLEGVVNDAGVALDSLRQALTRLELLETRIAATEHRLAVIERYQLRVLDAEATVRGAGIRVPGAGTPD
jgi:hypothetical protein